MEFSVGDIVRFDLEQAREVFEKPDMDYALLINGFTSEWLGPVYDILVNDRAYQAVVRSVSDSGAGRRKYLSLVVKSGSTSYKINALAGILRNTNKKQKLPKVKVGQVVQLIGSSNVRVVHAVDEKEGKVTLSHASSTAGGYLCTDYLTQTDRLAHLYDIQKVLRTPEQPEIGDLVSGELYYMLVIDKVEPNISICMVFNKVTGSTVSSRATIYFTSKRKNKVVAKGVRPRRSSSDRAAIRAVYANNVNRDNSPYSSSRYQMNNLSQRETMRRIGQELGKVYAGETDYDDLIAAGNSGGITSSLKRRLDSILTELDIPLFFCQSCGQIESTDGSDEVRHYGDIQHWCSDCIDSDAHYSEEQEILISSSCAVFYYATASRYRNGSHTYVTDSWGVNNAYYYDGAYFSSDAAYDLDIYEDEDEDEDDGLVNSYHSTSRNWRPIGGTKQFPCLGVEIEVYADHRRRAAEALREEFPVKDLYMEQDGSLDSYHGFEIITQPWGKDVWANRGPRILANLRSNGVVAYNHPDTDRNYGIHINLSRSGLSSMQEVRLFMFFADQRNANFVRAMAQREGIYHPDVDIGSLTDTKRLFSRGRDSGSKKYHGLGKYCPVNMRSSILEFRIFQSTLADNSFMKNLELIWALVDWTRHPTGTSWNHVDFVQWLSSRPQVEKDFPNLMAYLRKPEYRIKRGSSAIRNTWLPLVRPAVRSSIVVEQDEEQLKAA